MVINIFLYILLSVSILSLLMPIEKLKQAASNTRPLITFYDSTMYTLNSQYVNTIIQSQKMAKYDNRDEIYFGTLIARNNRSNQNNSMDIIRANFIKKTDKKIVLFDDVNYNRDDIISFKTQHLNYDLINEIAYNNKPFTANYYDDTLTGVHLYFNVKTGYFKASNTRARIPL